MADAIRPLDAPMPFTMDEAMPMREDPPRLGVDDLRMIVNREIHEAESFTSGKLAFERMKALQYYYREPFGNEREGRSKVVLSEVADTIEGILPSLLRVYTQGHDTVLYEPQEPGDVEGAEQATEYGNWVWNRKNPGFVNFYTWFKDALAQKNGAIKVYWSASPRVERETYHGLDEMELAQLLGEEGVSPIEANVRQETVPLLGPDGAAAMGPDGAPALQPATVYDVVILRSHDAGYVKVETIAPEDFRVSRDTFSLDMELCPFAQHRVRMTEADLLADGPPEFLYPAEPPDDFEPELAPEQRVPAWAAYRVEQWRRKVATLPDGDQATYDQESAARGQVDDQELLRMDPREHGARKVFLSECYLRIDWDGDGIPELRKILVANDGYGEILDNEAVDESPFCCLTPSIIPHRFYGWSVADQTMDLQLISSTILRQFLDNLFIGNNTRPVVDPRFVNMDDVLASSPFAPIRTTQMDAIRFDQAPVVAPFALPALEFMRSVKETRTGVSAYNQGLDADSLNKTATGISRIMDASQQRIELIARVFAETGVKTAFRMIYRLALKHEKKAKILRLRGKFVKVDPTSWRDDFDVTVNVGLGTGNRDQIAGHLSLIGQMQSEVVKAGGLHTLVTPKNVYNLARRTAENLGFKAHDEFFTDPDTPGLEPPPEKPDPKLVEIETNAKIEAAKLQLEAQRLEFEKQKALMDAELEQRKLELEHQRKLADIRVKELALRQPEAV